MSGKCIVFMPWANMVESVTFGNVSIRPWSDVRDRVPPMVKAELDKLFSRFCNMDGSTVSKLAVCELNGQTLLPKIDQGGIEEIRDAVNALAFIIIASGTIKAVAANNKSSGPSSSDRFQILPWDIPKNGFAHFKIGSIQHQVHIERLQVVKPLYAVVDSDSPIKNYVTDFQKLFELAANGREDAKRIIRSLDWFKLSQTNSPDVTFRSKLTMLVTAFEILLKIPKGHKSKAFATTINSYRSASGTDIEIQKSIDNQDQTISKKAAWAYDLYQVRNRIAHGDYVAPNDIWFHSSKSTFLNFDIVGCILFNECVSRALADLGIKNSYKQQPWDSTYRMLEWLP